MIRLVGCEGSSNLDFCEEVCKRGNAFRKYFDPLNAGRFQHAREEGVQSLAVQHILSDDAIRNRDAKWKHLHWHNTLFVIHGQEVDDFCKVLFLETTILQGF